MLWLSYCYLSKVLQVDYQICEEVKLWTGQQSQLLGGDTSALYKMCNWEVHGLNGTHPWVRFQVLGSLDRSHGLCSLCLPHLYSTTEICTFSTSVMPVESYGKCNRGRRVSPPFRSIENQRLFSAWQNQIITFPTVADTSPPCGKGWVSLGETKFAASAEAKDLTTKV